RLVGYLSIGSVQPDSLAIKSIIDEGLSIRHLKKALLKGDFDARKYLSRWRSQEALDMVTSGKVPAVKPLYYPMTPVRSFPIVSRPATIAVAHHSNISDPTLSAITKMDTNHGDPVYKPDNRLASLADQATIHIW